MNNQKYTHKITCVYCLDTIFVHQNGVYNNLSIRGWRVGNSKTEWWGSAVCPKCVKTLKEREKALDELTKQAQELDMGY